MLCVVGSPGRTHCFDDRRRLRSDSNGSLSHHGHVCIDRCCAQAIRQHGIAVCGAAAATEHCRMSAGVGCQHLPPKSCNVYRCRVVVIGSAPINCVCCVLQEGQDVKAIGGDDVQGILLKFSPPLESSLLSNIWNSPLKSDTKLSLFEAVLHNDVSRCCLLLANDVHLVNVVDDVRCGYQKAIQVIVD
jgi:hypothetical protein